MEKIRAIELEKEVINTLSQNKFMALSTHSENCAAVRMVSIINDGTNIYFMTLKTTAKFHQLKDNPFIDFCIGNMQGEGYAEIISHPLESSFFIERYKMYHESTFEIYGNFQDSIVIKIKPTLISFWRYHPEIGAYKDYLDIISHESYRKSYT